MPRPEFGDLLDCSLERLRAEAPPWFEQVCSLLGETPVAIAVDGPASTLHFGRSGVRRVAGDGGASVNVSTDTRTLLDVVDAILPIQDALRLDRLMIRGPVSQVIRFHEALRTFLDGAMRCPSFPILLRALRDGEDPRELLS